MANKSRKKQDGRKNPSLPIYYVQVKGAKIHPWITVLETHDKKAAIHIASGLERSIEQLRAEGVKNVEQEVVYSRSISKSGLLRSDGMPLGVTLAETTLAGGWGKNDALPKTASIDEARIKERVKALEREYQALYVAKRENAHDSIDFILRVVPPDLHEEWKRRKEEVGRFNMNEIAIIALEDMLQTKTPYFAEMDRCACCRRILNAHPRGKKWAVDKRGNPMELCSDCLGFLTSLGVIHVTATKDKEELREAHRRG